MAEDFELSEEKLPKGFKDPALEAARRNSRERQSFNINPDNFMSPQDYISNRGRSNSPAITDARKDVNEVTTPFDSSKLISADAAVRGFGHEELKASGQMKAAQIVKGKDNPDMMLNVAVKTGIRGVDEMKAENFLRDSPRNQFGDFSSVISTFNPDNANQVEAAKKAYNIGDDDIAKIKEGEVYKTLAVDKTRRDSNGATTINYRGTSSYLMTTQTFDKVAEKSASIIKQKEESGIRVVGSQVTEVFFNDKDGKEFGNEKKDTKELSTDDVAKPNAVGNVQQQNKDTKINDQRASSSR